MKQISRTNKRPYLVAFPFNRKVIFFIKKFIKHPETFNIKNNIFFFACCLGSQIFISCIKMQHHCLLADSLYIINLQLLLTKGTYIFFFFFYQKILSLCNDKNRKRKDTRNLRILYFGLYHEKSLKNMC
jgi:hypothetical protein